MSYIKGTNNRLIDTQLLCEQPACTYSSEQWQYLIRYVCTYMCKVIVTGAEAYEYTEYAEYRMLTIRIIMWICQYKAYKHC